MSTIQCYLYLCFRAVLGEKIRVCTPNILFIMNDEKFISAELLHILTIDLETSSTSSSSSVLHSCMYHYQLGLSEQNLLYNAW